jgi:Iap family predicted aminopeptidase
VDLMRRRPIALTAPLVVVLAAAPRAQPSLAKTVVAEAHVMAYVQGVTSLGARLTGTAGYERAAAWAADQLRAAGVPRVGIEPFAIPDGWERDRAAARIVSPEPLPLRIAALGWTPSTPGEIEAEVVLLTESAPEKIPAAQVEGRIVLVRAGDVGGESAGATRRRRELDRALARAGARAILLPDADRDNTLAARDRTFGAAVGALPAALIARDDAAAIRRMLDRGPVRAALDLRNRVTPGPVTVSNVIGEITGRDRAGDCVIVGAHLDAWDFAAGAQDNATGVAMVLEAARAIAAQPRRPLRSIRFVLWGGEEQGQLGSNAYVRAHGGEFDRWAAYLNTDAGSGSLIGWTAPGRHDVAEAGRRLLQPVLAAVAPVAFDSGMQYAFQSDGAAFVRAGIPTLDLNADDSAYEDVHHKTTDTLDRVDQRNVLIGAAVVAASAWTIADAPSRFAPRRPRGD